MPTASPETFLSLHRNNVAVSGNPDGPTIMFGHGFGGSRETWGHVARAFEHDYTVVVFDHVGAGDSDVSAYDRGKYDSLHGYADDILEIIIDLDLRDVTFVGHSCGSIMGILAANRAPELFRRLVLVGPSPRYINDGDYFGGFSQETVNELLDSLEANQLGWSSMMGPTIMGNAERPELAEALSDRIARIDPMIVAQFARVTFLSDNRRDLADVTVPTLILQSSDDVIAPHAVGEYVHRQISGSEFVEMTSRGHAPNLSDPDQVIGHIQAYLQ